MAVVVEVLNPSMRVLHRYFFSHNEISIGRAYDNDVILDDVHADPYHAIVRKGDESEFVVSDCGSLNGIRDFKKRRVRGGRIKFDYSQIFMLGDTRVRVTDADRPVPPAKALREDGWSGKLLNSAWTALILLVITGLSIAYRTFVSNVDDVDATVYLENLLSFMLGAIVLALVMSFVGKVVKREWRFYFNLVVLLGIGLIADGVAWVFGVIAFNINLNSVRWLFQMAMYTPLVGIFVWAILQSVIAVKRRFHKPVIGVSMLLLVGVLLLNRFGGDTTPQVARPVLTKEYKHPALQFKPAVSDEVFFARAQAVFDIDIVDEEDKKP